MSSRVSWGAGGRRLTGLGVEAVLEDSIVEASATGVLRPSVLALGVLGRESGRRFKNWGGRGAGFEGVRRSMR